MPFPQVLITANLTRQRIAAAKIGRIGGDRQRDLDFEA